MNAYGMDFLFDDLGVSDQFLYETLTREFHSSSPLQQEKVESAFRHDGTSPLPLGMDWSPPPQKWVCLFICLFLIFYGLYANLLISGIWVV